MKNRTRIYRITLIALLSALATVLMTFRFPLPLAPTFLEFDISELPALFAGFFLGPAAGCLVILIKNLLHLIFNGTTTAFVGEAMNIAGSICFVLPASLIYRRLHTKKGAIIALVTSSFLVSVFAIFLNALVAFPMYMKMFGIPIDAIISMGSATNPLVHSYWTLMIFGVLPFNLFKHGITSLCTYLLYKKVGNALRRFIGMEQDSAIARMELDAENENV
jgi:riboflavin transporter FmnP